MIRVTAFQAGFRPFAQGLVRDLRVRWALEEAGLPYEEHLIGPEDQDSAAYRVLQPFGQVPVLEEDETAMFESGAIVLHIADRSPSLHARRRHARELVRTWIFAALNSVEPPVMTLVSIDMPAAGRARRRRNRCARPSLAVSTSASTVSPAFSAIASTSSTAASPPPTS